MDQDRPQEAVRWPAGRTQRDSTRPPQRAHTPAPKHPGSLAFHFHPFPLCFGLFCNLFLGMTKPPQRTCASRQRADTRFSPLSWTHPIRAEAGFGIFRGGGWRCCKPSIQPEGLHPQGLSPIFSALSRR